MRIGHYQKNISSRKLGLVATLLLFSAAGLWLVAVHAAGNATLTLSPASGSYNNGSSFTVTISENSGSQPVNGVNATLTYDTAKLQFISLNTNGSPFGTCTQTSGGGGTVTIACVSLGTSSTGTKTVGAVTFKAVAGSGSTAVNFGSGSAVVLASDNSGIWNGNTAGGTYSLTTPASPPPPAPTPSPSPGPTPSPTPSNPSPSPSSPSPSPSPGSKTTTKATTKSSTPSPTPSTSDPVATVPDVAAQQADPSAPVDVSNTALDQSGYLVAVKAVDSSGKILVGAIVTLGDQTATSDSTGIASFTGVGPGKQDVTIKSKKDGPISRSTITVDADKAPSDVQLFKVNYKTQPRNPLVIILSTTLVALLLAGAYYGLRTGMLRRLTDKLHPVASTGGDTGQVHPDAGLLGSLDSTAALPPSSETLEELEKRYGAHGNDSPKPEQVIKPTDSSHHND